jgi:CheY-like chemotaxis protein
VLRLLRAVLEPEGWTVVGVTTGEAALSAARSLAPAVVLLDLLLPGMDGFSVVEALRAEPATADVPVVVLTAMSMTAEDKQRLNGHISAIAEKADFDPSALVRLVERHARPAAARPEGAP